MPVSIIMDSVMGQINLPSSTERICSFFIIFAVLLKFENNDRAGLVLEI